MPRLFLIRHGEPAAGWGDHADPGLSERGRAQAQAAAQTLAQQGLLQIWTSPLARCQETAAALVALTGQGAAIVPEIAEVPTPPDAPDRVAWLAETFPGIRGQPSTRFADLPEGLRAWRWAMLDKTLRIERDVAAFSHFIAINAIVSAALAREETIVFRPSHASITELSVGPEGLALAALGADVGAATVL